MEDQVPVERILMRIEELVRIIRDHRGPLDPNISLAAAKVDIDLLKKTLIDFYDVQREVFNKAQIDIDSLTNETLESSDLDPKDRQLLERTFDMEREVQALKTAYSPKGRKKKKKGQQGDNANEAQQIRERRKLFKTIGGDKKWIPL